MNALASKPALKLVTILKTVMTATVDAFASFAAAAAAATAIENNRQPAAADLRRLGLEGVKFKLNG